jgi:hypothetical protein
MRSSRFEDRSLIAADLELAWAYEDSMRSRPGRYTRYTRYTIEHQFFSPLRLPLQAATGSLHRFNDGLMDCFCPQITPINADWFSDQKTPFPNFCV